MPTASWEKKFDHKGEARKFSKINISVGVRISRPLTT